MIIKRVSEHNEILGIKSLQNKNLKSNLTKEEIVQEGFVTAEYSLSLLEDMNNIEPSIIAKVGDEVVGYAMVVNRQLQGRHELMDDLIEKIDGITFQGKRLKEVNYAVVGQLCVAKSCRGKGVVSKMYEYYKQELSSNYKYLITDVDEKNPRSVKAHINAGFQIVGSLKYGGSSWKIVLWDWNL